MTATSVPGRNDPCSCGSGRKYKQCCLEKDQSAARAARAKAEAEAPATAGDEPVAAGPTPRQRQAHQPWKAGSQNTRGFQKFSAPRKVGS
jgi:hypothetical protein